MFYKIKIPPFPAICGCVIDLYRRRRCRETEFYINANRKATLHLCTSVCNKDDGRKGLIWHDEIDNFLFNFNSESALNVVKRTPVHIDWRMGSIAEQHLTGAIGMHTLVIEYLA